jgi:hypothetical protein
MTLGLLLVVLTHAALCGVLGNALWRDRGWSPRWGTALGFIVGFWVLLPWGISRPREQRRERPSKRSRESAGPGGAGVSDRDGAGPVAT